MYNNNYNNFIHPIRRPNSSLFVSPQLNPRQQLPIYNGLYNNQHLLSKNTVTGPLIVKNKNLEDITNEKNELLARLKDKELLERKIIEKTELAIRQHHETQLNNVKLSIDALRNELKEKEELEKWVKKKKRRFFTR